MQHTILRGLLAVLAAGFLARGAAVAQEEAEKRRREEVREGAVLLLRESSARAARIYLEHLGDAAATLTGYLDVTMHLYWKEKDLPNVVTLSRAGIRYGLAKADAAAKDDAEGAARLRSLVKALAYNLASFTWPG